MNTIMIPDTAIDTRFMWIDT